MAGETQYPSAGLSPEQQAGHFGLLQLVRRIRAEHPDSRIQLRPALHRSIQQGEVFQATRQGQDWCIDINLPGLYGAASPLPAYLTELLLLQEQQEHTAARALLDLLNQRLYELQLETQVKAYPAIQQIEQQQTRWVELAQKLLGLPTERLAILPRRDWLFRHFHLLTQPYPTATGLGQLVSDWLQQLPVSVEQCVSRTVAVDVASRSQLGRQNNQLGNNTLLGDRIRDQNSKLRLHIGPLSHARFSDLIADRRTWRTLRSLISVYLRAPYDVELSFNLDAPQQVDTLTLGSNHWGHLGRNAWLLHRNAARSPASLIARMPLI